MNKKNAKQTILAVVVAHLYFFSFGERRRVCDDFRYPFSFNVVLVLGYLIFSFCAYVTLDYVLFFCEKKFLSLSLSIDCIYSNPYEQNKKNLLLHTYIYI